MAGVEAVFAHTCGSVQFGVFLEPHPQGPLLFTYIRVFGIVIAGDGIDGATLFFLRGIILGMNKHEPHGIGRLVIHVHTVGFEYPSQDLRCALYIGEAYHQASAVGVFVLIPIHFVWFRQGDIKGPLFIVISSKDITDMVYFPLLVIR